MNRTLSLYLDLVRFLAAAVVVLSHIWPIMEPRFPLPWPGHDAVVVFFVLSGLVIAHTTSYPTRTAAEYVIHRLARVWSVAVPALVLGVIVSLLIARSGRLGASVPSLLVLLSTSLANTLGIAEIWLRDAEPPLNGAFWSLEFEVWYYIIFGLWVFSSPRFRIALAFAGAFVAGPKIVLLLPAWLMGVAVYRTRFKLSGRDAVGVFVLTLLLGILYFWYDIGIQIRLLMQSRYPDFESNLRGANVFVGDNILAVLVALNFLAVKSVDWNFSFGSHGVHSVRKLASYTFSTYLYHLPLFALIWDVAGLRSPLLVVTCLLVGIAILGSQTEKRANSVRRLLAHAPMGPLEQRGAEWVKLSIPAI